MRIKRPEKRKEPRFVVRSVTGFAITPTRISPGHEKTIWSVHDSALCYREVPFGGYYDHFGSRGERTARDAARRLNAEVKATRTAA